MMTSFWSLTSMVSLVGLLLGSLFTTIDAGNESFCINSLPTITERSYISGDIFIDNSNPLFSVANSAEYHAISDTLFIAGDFMMDEYDPNTKKKDEKKNTETFYSYFVAYNADGSRLKYSPVYFESTVDSPIDLSTLRLYTNVKPHPKYDQILIYGKRLLQSYNATTGIKLWDVSSNIQNCSKNDSGRTEYVIYNDATFFIGGMCEIKLLVCYFHVCAFLRRSW